MGRHKIEIDADRVAELAGRGLSQAEICLILGISEKTLERRKAEESVLSEAMKKGRAVAADTIANKLFDLASGGDLSAIIWYEKTRRGLSDRVQQDLHIDLSQKTEDELQRIIES